MNGREGCCLPGGGMNGTGCWLVWISTDAVECEFTVRRDRRAWVAQPRCRSDRLEFHGLVGHRAHCSTVVRRSRLESHGDRRDSDIDLSRPPRWTSEQTPTLREDTSFSPSHPYVYIGTLCAFLQLLLSSNSTSKTVTHRATDQIASATSVFPPPLYFQRMVR